MCINNSSQRASAIIYRPLNVQASLDLISLTAAHKYKRVLSHSFVFYSTHFVIHIFFHPKVIIRSKAE